MRDFNAILALTALFQIVVGADPGDPTLAVPAAFFMAFFLMDAVFIRAALNGAEGDEEPPVFRPFRLVPLAVERSRQFTRGRPGFSLILGKGDQRIDLFCLAAGNQAKFIALSTV